MSLPNYVARNVPICFLTPLNVLVKSDTPMQLIFDAAKRYTVMSIPINMMMLTHLGPKMEIIYGDTFKSFLNPIYDLRITYPPADIVTHANGVKFCFKQMRLNPDIVTAFSIIVADYLYLQSALLFGTDFSPQKWEPVC